MRLMVCRTKKLYLGKAVPKLWVVNPLELKKTDFHRVIWVKRLMADFYVLI
jgi:hypothetical protein